MAKIDLNKGRRFLAMNNFLGSRRLIDSWFKLSFGLIGSFLIFLRNALRAANCSFVIFFLVPSPLVSPSSSSFSPFVSLPSFRSRLRSSKRWRRSRRPSLDFSLDFFLFAFVRGLFFLCRYRRALVVDSGRLYSTGFVFSEATASPSGPLAKRAGFAVLLFCFLKAWIFLLRASIASLYSTMVGNAPPRRSAIGSMELITILASGLRVRISSTTRRIPKTTTSSEHCMRPKSFIPNMTHQTRGLKSAGISPCNNLHKTLGEVSPAIPNATPSKPDFSLLNCLLKDFSIPFKSSPCVRPIQRPSISSTILSPINATSTMSESM
mmetsp:Transcript_31593/g.46624  ORF Transcript_31593/g.46624 Transcript_31593/m.46624 type:complete len:322 (-) Transcript_31593:561-1526(-)